MPPRGQSKEAWFFMRVGNSYKTKDLTSEAMALKGKMEVDSGLRAALTDADEGILRPGCLPKVSTSSAAGNKALLSSLAKAWEISPEVCCIHSQSIETYNLNIGLSRKSCRS